MLVSWLFLLTGSALLSFIAAWQIKVIPPSIGPVFKYNLIMLPLFFLANIFLGIGFIRAHETIKNLPLLVAGQWFMYYVFLLIFSLFLVDDRISVFRALAGFILMAAGVAVLGK